MVLFQQVDLCTGVNIRILIIVTIVVNWTIGRSFFNTCSKLSGFISTNSRFNS